MSNPLTVRRLLVDLDTPLPRHWCGGDAFRTAFMNALSMSFPAGEQLFIDSIRKALAELPADRQQRFAAEVQGFIGQEATHRRIHQRFNAHLEAQGLLNHYERRILQRRAFLESLDTRNWVAVTAATEHFTAVFAEHLLGRPDLLAGSQPRLVQMWLWHSAEESEHRATAFDIYTALGGNHEWRCKVFKAVARNFAVDTALQTWSNLWRDGTWWRPSTWVSAWTTLFGRSGLLRLGYAPMRRYLREDFHPDQGDGEAGVRWLAANAALVPAVARPATTAPDLAPVSA
jgi:predicted metal-dependent hydrolase